MSDDEDNGTGEAGEPGELQDEQGAVDNPLTKEVAGECLSLLCKTGNGLAHAYVRMDVKDKMLTDISILSCFVHVRYVDVSGNALEDISPLSALPHLLTIKADHNRLTSAKLQELQYLQIADFSHNRLTSTDGFAHPMLDTLNLSSNEITELCGLTEKNLPSLQTLDLHNNQLTSTNGIHIQSLQKLYLASNKLTKIDGLQPLKQLTTLHIRDNQISSLDGFAPSMEGLQYLNLRANVIEDVKELEKLKCLPYLRAMVLAGTPLSEMEEYRVEVCVVLRQLERLDKDRFTEDERADAEEISQQRQSELEQMIES